MYQYERSFNFIYNITEDKIKRNKKLIKCYDVRQDYVLLGFQTLFRDGNLHTRIDIAAFRNGAGIYYAKTIIVGFFLQLGNWEDFEPLSCPDFDLNFELLKTEN